MTMIRIDFVMDYDYDSIDFVMDFDMTMIWIDFVMDYDWMEYDLKIVDLASSLF